jgi:NTP pyrophosphatase (non-canonical NTP hydrolase)
MTPPLADATTTIAELKSRVLAFARERDWEQFHSPKNLSMALSAETGELMEHFLWADSGASQERSREPGRRQKIEEEIADVVIYSLEMRKSIPWRSAAGAQKSTPSFDGRGQAYDGARHLLRSAEDGVRRAPNRSGSIRRSRRNRIRRPARPVGAACFWR